MQGGLPAIAPGTGRGRSSPSPRRKGSCRRASTCRRYIGSTRRGSTTIRPPPRFRTGPASRSRRKSERDHDDPFSISTRLRAPRLFLFLCIRSSEAGLICVRQGRTDAGGINACEFQARPFAGRVHRLGAMDGGRCFGHAVARGGGACGRDQPGDRRGRRQPRGDRVRA